MHKSIREINGSSKAKSVYSFDFTTLYTSLPHDKLLTEIEFVIKEAFKFSKKNFIRISSKYACWAEKNVSKSNTLIYLTEQELLEWIRYLIDNIYVIFNNKVYKQVIGIPMGTDCAPDLANLFLFAYEYKYITHLISINCSTKSYFKYNSRYIDDLLTLNDKGTFLDIFREIYPQELDLKNTGKSPINCNYLDMNIEVIDGKFVTTLFDKRTEFNFKVISLPNLSSNIPLNGAYGVFTSQLHRLCKVNSDIGGFYRDIKLIMDKLKHQNFRYDKLLYTLHRYVNTNKAMIYPKYWRAFEFDQIR